MAEENIKKVLEDYKEETKRHFDVVAEDLKDEIKLIAEQHISIQDTLKSHTEMMVSIKEDIEVMKLDIEFIKGGLKKKVDYDEHTALERRVSLLEAKLR